ncbi:NAD(P)/FAD-dependent oxidoreductase [Jannaschia sp. Os4]|uniref:dihydrolipoyl dehydrogenase family protein n=1 Tax=Jannaschia sp. Os4 TaxID=2807617 RepID=UPI00193A3DDF|nr:NAD(P)/FAD-dependent oxidoreductase [Jannaschia sp. Os4]MBM2576382.1 NAD(P)/FAD-dependent oxidoreductase [Jannaschia sp. Os4]
MTRSTPFDLAVIGAGSGGMAAARRAAEAGLSVVVFEGTHVGGTCVNAGCVPKKLLVHAARMSDAAAEMRQLGWRHDGVTFDWPALRDAVIGEVDRLSGFHADRLRKAGIALVQSAARPIGPDAVCTGDSDIFRTNAILIATGARPMIPDLPGAEHCITSDDLFTLTALPERMAIVGGGYIAVEFACMLARFGVDVTILERGDRLIKPFDAEVSGLLLDAMRKQGITVRLGASVDAVDRNAEGLRLDGEGTGDDAYGEVLMAVGRAPNTDALHLGTVGIETTERGHIVVDDDGRTSVPSIRAVGDVCEPIALTPVAVRGARRVVDLLTGEDDPLPRPDLVPTAAFTTPECASVGLTADEARDQGHDVVERRTSFRPLAALVSGSDMDVFMKAVVARGDGRLLGFHFFGPHASEAAQLGAMALHAGLTANELHLTMPLHPSIAEEMIGLGMADEPLHQRVEDDAAAKAA